MLFSATKNIQLLKNRELMRRLLVTIKSKFTIAQVVDNYNVVHHRADDVQKKPPMSESSPCEGRRRRGDLRSFQSLLTARREQGLCGAIERMVQLRPEPNPVPQ